ncbi:hypothetical protein FHG87_011381 [Trinorchestia longiramus]|nr:hypothetical protein FHG87_011381 [Trinorchestia longiramus]
MGGRSLLRPQHSSPPSPLPPVPPLTYKRLVSSADTLSSLPLFPSHLALWGGVVKLIIGIGVAGVWGVGLGIGARFSSLGGGLWVGAVVALSGFLSVCGARRPHSQVYLVSLLCVSALSLLASVLLLLLSVAATAADAGASPPDFLLKLLQDSNGLGALAETSALLQVPR